MNERVGVSANLSLKATFHGQSLYMYSYCTCLAQPSYLYQSLQREWERQKILFCNIVICSNKVAWCINCSLKCETYQTLLLERGVSRSRPSSMWLGQLPKIIQIHYNILGFYIENLRKLIIKTIWLFCGSHYLLQYFILCISLQNHFNRLHLSSS